LNASRPADTKVACQWRDAVNFDDRACAIELLVFHYTGMQSEDGALDWLCRAESRVSCHYFVFSDGAVVQSVPEEKRAWHAGVSSWRGLSDLNSRSIGIEIANPGHEFGYVPFPDKQIRSAVELSRDIVARNKIAARDVVGHSDIAPMRKQDPGELFPWRRFAAAGAGTWVPPSREYEGTRLREGDSGDGVLALQRDLARWGFAIEESGDFDAAMACVVRAFQRHYRPARIDGQADASTRRTLARLLETLC
jgi:N-acetylmuramoyl-L-alanine amidase